MMSNTQEQPQKKDNQDAFDSYYECITACYGLSGEDVECVTQCVQVHLEGEPDIN